MDLRRDSSIWSGMATMTPVTMTSFAAPASALVIGATGGIGDALCRAIEASGHFETVTGLGRATEPPLDLTSQSTIEAAARRAAQAPAPLRLVIDATGFLHGDGYAPEKSFADIDPAQMAHAFAINAFGPALLMKHFLPLLPKDGKSVFATLSARVGSIGDNRIGGWYSYRASKAALNQFVHTAAIELARKKKNAVCCAMHPGTVDTSLSEPFSKSGLKVRAPEEAARDLLTVIDGLDAEHNGGFFDYAGDRIPW